MQKVKFNGKDYDYDSLSDNVKGQLTSLQFVDAEITRHQNQIAVFQTARLFYVQAMQKGLDEMFKPPTLDGGGDTLKL